jgi:uncharacterized lipoprotein YddW (UPF0748 family)
MKSIFVGHSFDGQAVERVSKLGADAVFIGHKKLNNRLTERLHRSGTKVFAEVGLFAGEEFWKKFSKSRPIDSKGQKIKKEDWYAGVCPNHHGVRQEKLREIEKILSNFELDGVWLDFIRYPTHWEVPHPRLLDTCYCQNCLEKFRKDTGLSNPEGEPWIRWRCKQVTDFVAAVHTIIRSSKSDSRLGIFAVPWTENDFGGAITKIIGQDFKSLSKYIDVFSPMTYHKMCGRDIGWITKTVRYFYSLTGKPVLPLVQTENKPVPISPGEFRQSIECALKEPSKGVIVFFLEDLLAQPKKLKVVREVFKRKV